MPKKSVSGPESVKTDHVGDTGKLILHLLGYSEAYKSRIRTSVSGAYQYLFL